MLLIYTDKDPISELTDFESSEPVAMRPVEFTAKVSELGASRLADRRPEFFRAEEAEERFTVTIDKIDGVKIQGTIRRR